MLGAQLVVMFLGLIVAANMNVHAAQPVETLEDLGVTEKGGILVDKNGRAIDAIYYNEEDVIIEYTKENTVPDEAGVVKESVAVPENGIMGRATKPHYTSTLTPHNDYAYLHAWSRSDIGIKKMEVTVSGRTVSGSPIPETRAVSPEGYMTMATSAYLKPKDFGLNYKVGSGVSQHYYSCTGIGSHSDVLRWVK